MCYSSYHINFVGPAYNLFLGVRSFSSAIFNSLILSSNLILTLLLHKQQQHKA